MICESSASRRGRLPCSELVEGAGEGAMGAGGGEGAEGC